SIWLTPHLLVAKHGAVETHFSPSLSYHRTKIFGVRIILFVHGKCILKPHALEMGALSNPSAEIPQGLLLLRCQSRHNPLNLFPFAVRSRSRSAMMIAPIPEAN